MASTLGLFVLVAFAGVDVQQFSMTKRVRQDAGFQTDGGYAVSHMLRRLEAADRANLITDNPANVQFRVPVGQTNLDAATNYVWAQYRYDMSTKRVFFFNRTENGCSAYRLAENVTGLTINYADEAPPPPGGVEPLPGGLDNNVLQLELTTQDPTTQNILTFRGEVVMRAGAYTAVSTGLSPVSVSQPPAACPPPPP